MEFYRQTLKHRENVHVVSICDEYEEKVERLAKEMENYGKARPQLFTDYKRCIDESVLDAVRIYRLESAYKHDLRDEVTSGEQLKHCYYLDEYFRPCRASCFNRTDGIFPRFHKRGLDYP